MTSLVPFAASPASVADVAAPVPAPSPPPVLPAEPSVAPLRWNDPRTLALGVYLLVLPWGYWAAAHIIFCTDPQAYGQHAKQMLEGQALYSDVRFDKGPFSALFYALPQLVAPRDPLALGWFNGAWIAMQGVVFAWFFRDNRAAAVAGVLFSTLAPFTHLDLAWVSTEHASNAFVLAVLLTGYAIADRGRFGLAECAAAGALVCVAFNTRQPTLPYGLVPAVAILLAPVPWERRIRGLACLGLGAVATFVPVVGVVSLIGDVPGYFHAILGGAQQYAASGSWMRAVPQIEGLFNSFGGPALLFLGLALAGRFRWIALAAVLAGVATVVLPRREWWHYLVNLIPAVALCIAAAADRRCARCEAFRRLGAAFVLAVFAPPAFEHVFNAAKADDVLKLRPLVARIDSEALPGSTLMAVGRNGVAESIVYMSQLPPVHKFWVAWELDYVPELLDRRVPEIREDYLRSPPGAIALDATYCTFRNGRWIVLDEAFVAHRGTATTLGLELALRRPGEYRLVTSEPLAGFWVFLRRQPAEDPVRGSAP